MNKDILIVDDAAFIRMMLKSILTEAGYAVAGEAEDGTAGVKAWQELKPALTLMDITMPVMDGIQATRLIKKEDPAAKIIICSALGQQAQVIEAIEAGAADFVVKPFQKQRILEAVKKVLG